MSDDTTRLDGGGAPFNDGDAMDADVMLMVSYCSGELTEDQAERVDVRLATDATFRQKAEPLIAAWLLTTVGQPSAEPMAIDPGVEARALTQFRAGVLRAKDRKRAFMNRWVPRRIAWPAAIAATLLVVLARGALLTGVSMLTDGPSIGGLERVAGHGLFFYKTRVVGDASGHTVADLGGGSRVELSAGSTIAYRRKAVGPGMIASLTGTADVQVEAGIGHLELLSTVNSTLATTKTRSQSIGADSIEVLLEGARFRGLGSSVTFQPGMPYESTVLTPGLYHIHTFGKDSTVLDVVRGEARSPGSADVDDSFLLHPGEHVLITGTAIVSVQSPECAPVPLVGMTPSPTPCAATFKKKKGPPL